MAVTCDACGLPPRPNQKRLLKCTRCKQAQYHDRQCQQNHYPKHKAECRRIAAAAAAKKTGDARPVVAADRVSPRKLLVECRSVAGRGRSLIATSALAIGSHPLPAPANDGLCEPIAHPVLNEKLRTSRCSFCFQAIDGSPAPNSSAPPLHYHCSAKCQSLDKNWRMEGRAAQKLRSPPTPLVLSCSRILRRFQTSPAALTEYNQLCWDIDALSQDEKDTYHAIMTQCHAFLVAMEDTSTAKVAHDLLHPNPTPAYRFMSRLSRNGFSISNSEQIAIGHGVYCGASMMNHSCRANAVPSFWLRDASPPMLQITMCKSVTAGEEVTISYCDTSTPRHIRIHTLWKNYKFVCDCSLCQDLDRDDDVVGLKCKTEGCKGRVRAISAPNENDERALSVQPEAKNMSSYKCNSCGNSSFSDALGFQADSMEKMKILESKMSDITNIGRFDKKAGEESEHIYHSLKKHCNLQTSFYLAWSADLFVYWCANAFELFPTEQEKVGLCRQALGVMNESRSATKFCVEYPGNVSWYVKRGLEAKFRLFVNPMDMEALMMLKKVKEDFRLYYPSSDDTMRTLDESLAAYSFS